MGDELVLSPLIDIANHDDTIRHAVTWGDCQRSSWGDGEGAASDELVGSVGSEPMLVPPCRLALLRHAPIVHQMSGPLGRQNRTAWCRVAPPTLPATAAASRASC